MTWPMSWTRDVTRAQWKTLLAAQPIVIRPMIPIALLLVVLTERIACVTSSRPCVSVSGMFSITALTRSSCRLSSCSTMPMTPTEKISNGKIENRT